MTDKQPDERAEYITGLRAMADILETNPGIPLPEGAKDWNRLTIGATWVDDPRARLALIIRTMPGPIEKVARADSDYLRVRGQLHGLYWMASALRDEVCERRVTGTREVTETVPDPDAPLVEVTRTVEDVEWVCAPLLGGAQ